MNDYFVYYAESTIVCLIAFSMMFIRDLFKVDKQEKQIKYDHALIPYMLYFVSDVFWAAVLSGVLPRTRFTVTAANFSNSVFMGGITYMWLRYVLAAENAPYREKKRFKLGVLLLFITSTLVLTVLFLFSPHTLMDGGLNIKPLYYVFLVVVPCIYISSVVVYTLGKARKEENPIEKRKHLHIGLIPLTVIAGGLMQILVLPNTPIFCYCCTLMMLWFYLQSMETQISLDPLTRLNNRGQLERYVSQKANIRMEGRATFVIMFDVNNFKKINDTYGHAEGDRALVIMADSLKTVAQRHNMPIFLGRYGGDEFILIAHPIDKNEIDLLIGEIREQIESKCRAEGAPYLLSVGAGYDELADDGEDTFQKCMLRADRFLYENKAQCKKLGQTTVCN